MPKPQYDFPDVINNHTLHLLQQHIKYNRLLISWYVTPYISITEPYTASLYKRKSTASMLPSLSCCLLNCMDKPSYHIELPPRYTLKIVVTEY